MTRIFFILSLSLLLAPVLARADDLPTRKEIKTWPLYSCPKVLPPAMPGGRPQKLFQMGLFTGVKEAVQIPDYDPKRRLSYWILLPDWTPFGLYCQYDHLGGREFVVDIPPTATLCIDVPEGARCRLDAAQAPPDASH